MRVRPTVNDSATPTEVSVIDADKVGGFIPSQTPAANQIPVKDGNNNLTITSGNVGIGVSTPTAKMEVLHTSTTVPQMTLLYNSTSPVLSVKMNDNGDSILEAPGGGVSGGRLCFYLSATERMRIEASGNVLIGTPTDAGTGKLQVAGDGYFSGDVSAATFTDRTPFFEGDALTLVRRISGKDGELNHKSLPAFAYVKKLKKDDEGNEKEEEGRDIGAMLSVLTVAVQQLLERVEALEGK